MRGRPRSFDEDDALEKAMRLFWDRGYEGASLDDLTRAMGVNPPSLYSAFGSKEALFRRALDRYQAGPGRNAGESLEAPTAREVADRFCRSAARLQSDRRNPGGCLIAYGTLTGGKSAARLRVEQTRRRTAIVKALARRFACARAEGDLPSGSDPADLARFVATIVFGMAIMARDGASLAQLERVVGIALGRWPAAVRPGGRPAASAARGRAIRRRGASGSASRRT